MSKGINKAIILGRLGQDPEIRATESGSSVANLSIATSEEWKDKNTGEKKEKTEWHRVVAFGRLAEIIGEYVKKGSLVYIEGQIQTRKWQDQAGNDRYSTEIVAKQMQMLGGRAEASNAPGAHQGDVSASPPEADPFDDSDIPF